MSYGAQLSGLSKARWLSSFLTSHNDLLFFLLSLLA